MAALIEQEKDRFVGQNIKQTEMSGPGCSPVFTPARKPGCRRGRDMSQGKDRAAVELRLQELMAQARGDAPPEDLARVECEALVLLQPWARMVIRRHPSYIFASDKSAQESVRVSDFDSLFLSLWRQSLSSEARFDPGRGTFMDYVLQRFRLRLSDFLREERHIVHRASHTESRRRRQAEPIPATEKDNEAWGYVREGFGDLRDPVSEREMKSLEARIDLDILTSRLTSAESDFLRPLLQGRVETLKDLSRLCGVTPAAVDKRLKKIRRRLAGLLNISLTFHPAVIPA